MKCESARALREDGPQVTRVVTFASARVGTRARSSLERDAFRESEPVGSQRERRNASRQAAKRSRQKTASPKPSSARSRTNSDRRRVPRPPRARTVGGEEFSRDSTQVAAPLGRSRGRRSLRGRPLATLRGAKGVAKSGQSSGLTFTSLSLSLSLSHKRYL